MSVIEDVKANVDIIDIVSETVALKKSGRSYTGFCPFHQNTRTPSFVVFPDTQTWRCFGACAEGGDLFSYLMKRDGYSFKEALHALAERAGIAVTSGSDTPVEDKDKQKFLELNAAAATYFHNLLTQAPAAAEVRDYLVKRELTSDTIALFELGYALNEWDALIKHFTARGYTLAELVAAGLVTERDDGSPGYDRFRHRLMIPIRDAQGKVIGFGARALEANQVPKYLNSPQTTLFDKSSTLYGLDLAKKHIRQAEQVVIVEGYMDVIQAYQRGAANVVAQMGTALTEQQLKVLKRFTSNLVLALDSDAAGNAATLRGINTARETLDRETVPTLTASGLVKYEGKLNANISIAALPSGKDPDDILREGLEVWQSTINQALPVVDFYFKSITSNLDLETAKGKSAAVRELIPILRDISDSIEQGHYLQKLSRLIHVDERILLAELQGVQNQPKSKRKRRQQAKGELPPEKLVTAKPQTTESAASKLETYCLGVIINNPHTLIGANTILEQHDTFGLSADDLKRGDNKEIFQSLQLWTASQEPKLDILVEMVGEDLAPHLANLASQWHNRPKIPIKNLDRDLSLAILRLKLQNLNEQVNELTFIQQDTSSDTVTTRQYTEMVEYYKQQRKKLEHIRDALSLVGQRRLETDQYGESDPQTKKSIA